MQIRELRFRIQQNGFRPKEIVLVTTLLDAVTYPKDEVAALYRERWHCELDLNALKTTLQMKHLRCKTPRMVQKEVWGHLLAYNLLRQTMVEAAQAHGMLPRQISFKATMQGVNSFAPYLALKPEAHGPLWSELLKAIVTHEVGDRPDRVEPRKVKYRLGNDYPYLTKPRSEERRKLCA